MTPYLYTCTGNFVERFFLCRAYGLLQMVSYAGLNCTRKYTPHEVIKPGPLSSVENKTYST